MAIVVYRCDVCKREIELPRNIEGLERVSRCTITQGCRGKLYQTNVFPDFIRGSLPDDVAGLNNWIQRKVLHNHTQAIERDEWVIVHNMGVAPIVSVFVDRPIEGNLDNREEITPEDIIFDSADQITLRFDRPWSGIAQLVGRQSDPDLLRPFQRAAEIEVPLSQMSNNGDITIATRIDKDLGSANVQFNVQYNTATGTSPLITYTADDQPSVDSAWADFNKAVIKGKVYTMRSFQALVPEMTSGVINSGSTFRFANVDWTEDGTFESIGAGEMFILLAASPFQVVDKLRDRFIDVTSVTPTLNPFAFVFDTGEFFADPTVIQTIYPPIRSV